MAKFLIAVLPDAKKGRAGMTGIEEVVINKVKMLESYGHSVSVLHDGIDIDNGIRITVGQRTDVEELEVSRSRPVQGLFEIIRSMIDNYDVLLVEGAFHMSKHLYRLKCDYPNKTLVGTFHISTKLGMSWNHSIDDIIACTRMGVYLDFISSRSKNGFYNGLTVEQKNELNDSYLVNNLQPLYYDNDIESTRTLPLAYFGRISEQTKRVATLIRICEESKIPLHLYGSVESDCYDLITSDLLHYKYVEYKGQLKQSEVQDTMSKYKATVTFSDCEVFGNVVSRSLQLGIPCIVNGDCDGTQEVLALSTYDSHESFVAKRTKPRMMYSDWKQSLSETINRVLNEFTTNDSLRLKKSAIDLLGYDATSRDLMNFYRKAMTR